MARFQGYGGGETEIDGIGVLFSVGGHMGGVKWWVFWAVLLCGAEILRAQMGTFDASFKPTVNGTVRAIATQTDGKMVVVGEFDSVNGESRRGIARFNADGTFDADFAKGLPGTNGPVYCVAMQLDGKILLGGDFTTVHGVGCNRLAQLNADGTLDTTFVVGSGVNGPVYAIAVLNSTIPNDTSGLYPSGLLIGGSFTTVQGATRNNLAWLATNGGLSSHQVFDGGTNGPVYAICSRTPYYFSLVYIGGDFSTINGLARNRVALVSSLNVLSTMYSGATDGPDGPVYALSMISNRLYVGGDFNHYSGQSVSKLAVVDSAGVLQPDFPISSLDGAVRSFAVQTTTLSAMSTSSIYFGGDFTNVNGATTGHVGLIMAVSVKTNSSTSSVAWDLKTSYAPPVNEAVYALGVELDGKLIVGGKFDGVGSETQPKLARIYGEIGTAVPETPAIPIASVGSDTQIFVNWSKSSNTTGHRIERSLDGVQGWVSVASGSPLTPYFDASLPPGTTYYYRVVASNSNGDSLPSAVTSAATLGQPWAYAGAVDTAFLSTMTHPNSRATAFAALRKGGLLVAASYGFHHYSLGKLDSNGVIDLNFWQIEGTTSSINSIVEQKDGWILVGGSFDRIAGNWATNLGRLKEDGTYDTTFSRSAGTNGVVNKVVVQPDDRILVGGSFTTAGLSAHVGLARFSSEGIPDSAFTPQLSTNGQVRDIVIQPDGKIVVVGSFTSVNGITRGNIVRLNPDGSVDETFATGAGASSFINHVCIQSDGKLIISGTFTTYDGLDRGAVARLNVDGTLDPSFNPGPVLMSFVNVTGDYYQADALAIQNDGKILLGGMFAVLNGKVRLRLARLNPDGSVDESFLPGLGATNSVDKIVIQPDGKFLVGGYFNSFNGQSVWKFVRLLGDNGTSAPATPSTVTATAVSTSSTQLTWNSIPFSSGYQIYQSVDGVNDWTLVGTAPSDSTSTTITGLSAGTSRYYRVRAYNSNGPAADSIMVTGTSYTPYQQWKVNKSLAPNAPDTDDAIGKGVPHLLDYAFGGDPLAYDAESILPRLDVPDNQMQISFWCDTERTDLVYTVQASSDLIHWEDIAQSTSGTAVAAVNGNSVIADSGSGRRKVSVTDATTIGSAQQRYLRVKVTTP